MKHKILLCFARRFENLVYVAVKHVGTEILTSRKINCGDQQCNEKDIS